MLVVKQRARTGNKSKTDPEFWATMLISPMLYGIMIPILYQLCKKLGEWMMLCLRVRRQAHEYGGRGQLSVDLRMPGSGGGQNPCMSLLLHVLLNSCVFVVWEGSSFHVRRLWAMLSFICIPAGGFWEHVRVRGVDCVSLSRGTHAYLTYYFEVFFLFSVLSFDLPRVCGITKDNSGVMVEKNM